MQISVICITKIIYFGHKLVILVIAAEEDVVETWIHCQPVHQRRPHRRRLLRQRSRSFRNSTTSGSASGSSASSRLGSGPSFRSPEPGWSSRSKWGRRCRRRAAPRCTRSTRPASCHRFTAEKKQQTLNKQDNIGATESIKSRREAASQMFPTGFSEGNWREKLRRRRNRNEATLRFLKRTQNRPLGFLFPQLESSPKWVLAPSKQLKRQLCS